MGLAERDNYIIDQLAAAAPLTGRQAVCQVARMMGALGDVLAEKEITGLQAAVSALQAPALRAQITQQVPYYRGGGVFPDFPCTGQGPPTATRDNPSGVLQIFPTAAQDAPALAYQLRVVLSGN